MSNILGNTPSEMLHLFVDGELSSSQEHILFSELAGNDDLQSEMRELLSIRDSVQNDIEAFTPPVEATQGVFSRLGFTSPGNQPIPAPLPYSGGIMSNFVRKAWLPVAAALVASLGTFLLLQNNDGKEVIQAKSNNIPITRSVDNNDLAMSAGSIIASPLSNGASALSGVNVHKSQSVTSKSSRTNNTIALNNGSYMAPANFAVQIIPQRNKIANNDIIENANSLTLIDYALPISTNRISNGLINDFPGYEQGNVNYLPLSSLGSSEKSGLSMVMRGIHAESYPGSNLPSKAYPIFSNMSLGLHYQLSENFQLGAEIGQEAFGQILRTPTEITYQNPMVFWGAASIKYEAGSHLFNLAGAEPFAQVLLGGTEMGPLAKGIIGLQFVSADWGFGMNFGIEGTTLLYNFNNELYRTDKLGITYGIIYSF
jgi:hypothetical protein